MSELEKAKQIAAEAFNFKSKAYTTIEQQNEIIKVNRKAFMQIISLPSLTIPKSIAEKTVGYFDKDRPNYFERSTRFVFSNWSSDLNGDNFDENEFDKRIQIVGAYLNPLTRDLVKVVADD
ncbi:hypothetical protein [Lactococcus lactis]|uniref:hypothetical protein n=1 Tax=Lactococcus lactis TaxID=1358 RepID=UPI0024164B44|nr:hypothetical protein [Lactococcus lactis]MDG4957950.1 hypothetical protein [Lactococcus lactis]